MNNFIIETKYPLTFRKEDAQSLGEHLKNRNSVVLIGAKRVGIGNFLRFFLYHSGITKTYIKDGKKHLFIPVDLNDLVEIELLPFWTLLLKRIVDAISSSNLEHHLKKYAEMLFLDSIASQDLFLRIDAIRHILVKLAENEIFPTLFLLRFDRLKDIVTPDFFANLEGLEEAAHGSLAYVFTSFRSLDKLSLLAFPKSSLSAFFHNMYIKPTQIEDTEVIFNTYKDRYNLSIKKDLKEEIFKLVDGYVHYLQLVLIGIYEKNETLLNKKTILEGLINDERIILQSEELWESLEEVEKEVLFKIYNKEKITEKEKDLAKYLWDTGFITRNSRIFSPIFESYVCQKGKKVKTETIFDEFSKKELLLFNLLKENIDQICEREKIIEAVWSEVESLGVSDWAIDRLVARLRNKLKLQKSHHEILTVKTRGYKLILSS